MFITLFSIINLYIFIRGWQALPDKNTLHVIYTLAFLAVLISSGLGVYFDEYLPEKTEIILKVVSRYWIVYAIFFFLAAAFADFLRILDHYFRILPAWSASCYKRIRFSYLIFILLTAIIFSFFGYRQFDHPQNTELHLTVNTDNNNFGEFKILVASDLHLGPFIRKERLAEWVENINNTKPDIILLVGDIFDNSFRSRHSEGIITEFRKFRSTYGVYAVPGNHEYYFNIKRSLDYLNRSAIVVLRDSCVTIDDRFLLAGRDDFHNRERKTIDSLLRGTSRELPVILMDHQPLELHESAKNNIDLQISGHTHNGQIFPFNYLAFLKWELPYGYRKIDNTQFYVTSGLGLTHIPLRLGTRSEIVSIRLRGNSDAGIEVNVR